MKKKQKQFKWSKGFNHRGVDANIVGAELEKHGVQNDAKGVVDIARNPDSPLHPLFEWNKDKAADLWNRKQARDLLSHITYIVLIEGEPTPVRAYHCVVTSTEQAAESEDAEMQEGQHYVELETVIQNPDYMDQIIQQAKDDLTRVTNKYRTYKKLFKLVAALDDVIKGFHNLIE